MAFLPELSDAALEAIRADVEAHERDGDEAHERDGDVVVLSINRGDNWGYDVPEDRRRFARALVDRCGTDVVHGHSSHHPRGLELHAGRPILYGVGDLLNDYEGISGHERYRGELTLLHLPTLEPGSGALTHVELKPMRIRRFRLERAPEADAARLRDRLDREGRAFGTRVRDGSAGRLVVEPAS